MSEFLKNSIRDIKDFPKQGIIFKDISTLLKDKDAYREVMDILYEHYKDKNIDVVAAVDARGFIFAAVLAYRLGVGFVPIRKPGKLPAKTFSVKYELEYGVNELCIHEDACFEGENVLLVDDLLATGGTVGAACELLKKIGANIVSVAFLIELGFLNGRDKLKGYDVFSILKY